MERDEQKALFEWARWQIGKYPELEYMFHIPNEGKRSARAGADLKRQGLKSGVPDIFLPVPRGEYHGLFIELKYGKNKATKVQALWLDRLKSLGYQAVVSNGWENAARIIISYLQQEGGKEDGE